MTITIEVDDFEVEDSINRHLNKIIENDNDLEELVKEIIDAALSYYRIRANVIEVQL